MSPTGHLAIGFATKKYAPEIPVLVFLIAAYAIDLIYFIFLALGMDTFDYDPWSHSLLMVVIWSLSAGLITFSFSRKMKSGLVIGLVVFSHWILDFIVWDNLPIYFDETHRVGLGLYNKIGFSFTVMALNSGTVIACSIELSMLMIGLAIYIIYLKKQRRKKE
ncbi:MAG: hypothetical protein K0R46_588 [Herbinix sp.]|jgi:hypothetical protein|nr:hypothetical protein [Herbinix sp.]